MFRVLVLALIGLMSSNVYAQGEFQSLPSIISFLLEQDSRPTVDLQTELRFRQTREFDEENDELLSITTPTYDSSGRVVSQVQQILLDGELDAVSTTNFEYDVLGRVVFASTVLAEVSGDPPTSIETTFSYFPLVFRLREVVTTSISSDGTVGRSTQQFDYDTVDRISQVVSVLSGPQGEVSIIDVPSYAGARITSVSRTISSALGGISTITITLGFSAVEHISTTIERDSSIEEISLSFASGIQTIRRGLPNNRFRNVTEYENGTCDLSNEENRRIFGIFAIPNPTGGLGRQCR